MRYFPYFVLLTTQNGGATPLVDIHGNMHFFETEGEARVVAQQSVLGEWYGYEIFQRGEGESK
jgi:hypothetical protein